MRLWERLSANIFRIISRRWLRAFEAGSPEKMLLRSLELLDDSAINNLRAYVISRQHASGGFMDRAGNPDLYYTLFGYFLSLALKLDDNLYKAGRYVESEAGRKIPEGVHLHCAAILAAGLSEDKKLRQTLQGEIRKNLENNVIRQSGYGAFVSLLSGYYTSDYRTLLRIKKQLDRLEYSDNLPSTVIAALLVLKGSFNRPVDNLRNRLMDFYVKEGGFRAVRTAPLPDLLSTAVVLYSLRLTGYDMRIIKPGCLNFIDSLYADGGFSGNIIDTEPDIEYTFYGLLALGSLAD